MDADVGIRSPTGAWSAVGRRQSAGIVYDVELTLELPRADGRHRYERARTLRRGALRPRPQRSWRRACARGRGVDRPLAARRRRAPRRSRCARNASARRRRRRRGARARGSRAGPRDGAGARGPLWPVARRDERALPAAGLANRRVPEGVALRARSAARSRGARRARRFHRLRDFDVQEDLPSGRGRSRRAGTRRSAVATAAEIERSSAASTDKFR